MINHPNTITFRKSHIVLIIRLIVLELILACVYLVMRIPKSIIFPSFSILSDNQLLNIIGVVYFIALSIIELIFVLQITLDWSSEQFEIREQSLVHRKGIFRPKQQTYTLRNLGSANIYQGLVGKMLNYGTITITSPILKNDIVLPDIHNPQRIVTSLEDNIEKSGVKEGSIIQRKS